MDAVRLDKKSCPMMKGYAILYKGHFRGGMIDRICRFEGIYEKYKCRRKAEWTKKECLVKERR